jgi:hypothetical protein
LRQTSHLLRQSAFPQSSRRTGTEHRREPRRRRPPALLAG